MWASTRVGIGGLGIGIVDGRLRDGGWCGTMEIGNPVGVGRGSLSVVVVAFVGIGISVRTMERLWLVWYNLHPTWDWTSRPPRASRVSGRGRASESLSQLLNEGVGDVVGRDMDGIGNTKNDQRTFGRERKTRPGRVETCPRGLLNLAYSRARFPNDRTNEDVRNEQTKGISFRLRR